MQARLRKERAAESGCALFQCENMPVFFDVAAAFGIAHAGRFRPLYFFEDGEFGQGGAGEDKI